jgi:hypothetical protein
MLRVLGAEMAAGWHADPMGRNEFRYWDGSAWTDHVSNNGVVGSDPPDLAPPTDPAAGVDAAEPPTGTTVPNRAGPRRKWLWIVGTAVGTLLVIGVVGAITGGSDDSSSSNASHSADATAAPRATEPSTLATTATTTTPPTTAPPTTTPPTTTPPTTAPTTQAPKPTAPPAPAETPGQANARRSALEYLSLGTGFSRAGLIQQLSSSFGEGFSLEDATYGVDATHTDWNAQACLSAKGYLKLSAFSHAGLVEQLSSEAGEQFTPDEAEYGVTCAGL